MKLLWALMLPVILMLSGCGKRAPAAKEGADLRKKAYVAVSENKSKILAVVIEAYRAAEYRSADALIDAAIERDFEQVRKNAAANGGNVPVEMAIDGARKLLSVREKERADARERVDAVCAQLKAAVEDAETEMLIANKLNDALEEYESSGVDLSAARGAIDEILELVKKRKNASTFVSP